MMTTCPTGGTAVAHSGFITADETWGPGPHDVTSTVTVRTGIALTISPCATVRLAPDASLVVDDDSRGLIARGTATQPIRFERRDASQAWGSLQVWAPATANLAYATLEGGGTTTTGTSADFVGATLVARNQTDVPVDILRVEHVTVRGSTGLGVFMQHTGFDAASADLTVTASGTQPVYLAAQYATNLPTGAYTGNGDDQFLLQSTTAAVYLNDEPITRDATIRNRGIPYRVGTGTGSGTRIRVGDGRTETPAATLTIEPGVTLRFERQTSGSSQLYVDSHLVGSTHAPQGVLVANGTATAPITFTSAADSPAPGDWQGLYFNYVVDPRTSITNAVIAYAGADSSTRGICEYRPGSGDISALCSVVMFLDDNAAPSAPFITDSSIEHSSGCGFYRGWRETQTDFASVNRFVGIAGCLQSNVPVSGMCGAMCASM